MQKYSCCLILVLLQEIERAANNKLRFSDCESGVYQIISSCTIETPYKEKTLRSRTP